MYGNLKFKHENKVKMWLEKKKREKEKFKVS